MPLASNEMTDPATDGTTFTLPRLQCAAETDRKEGRTIVPVVQLRERWGQAPRDRLSGADLKPLQAAAVKSRGRERWRKSSGHDPEQVCVRETSESKPADDASLRSKCHQNQRREAPLGQVCREPD